MPETMLVGDGLELLADVVGAFCERDGARVRALRDSKTPVDRETWGRLAENGWLQTLVPEEFDGAGLGLDAAAIIARGLGRGAFPEPFVPVGVLATLVLAAASEEQRLRRVMSGEALVALAWHDVFELDAAGKLTGRGRHLGVAGADSYIVPVRTAEGLALWWVSADAAGISVDRELLADGTLWDAITLDRVPGEELVPPGEADGILSAAVDAGRVVLSAQLLGIADAVLELTLPYVKQRKQFGRAIGSFQTMHHRAVDMWIGRELTSAALDAALAVQADPSADRHAQAVAAAGLKARAAQAVPAICASALQAHGAIGFTDEYDLGLYLNRALALAPWLGDAAGQRRRYVDLTISSAG